MPPTIVPLATCTPPNSSRTWSSTPHPSLPLLATACTDKTVRIYSLRDFGLHSVVSGGHKRSVRSCAWQLNGGGGDMVLATGSFDASCGIWRRKMDGGIEGEGEMEVDVVKKGLGGRGEEEEEEEWDFAVILDGHDSEIKSVAFCPTAPLLATCSRDKSVWIWEELDGDNFETVAVLQEHEGDVKSVAWHPEEECVVSGSYDDTVRVWREDGDDWACCAVLRGHGGTVWWVEFEGGSNIYALDGGGDGELGVAQRSYVEKRLQAGPRLMSASEDRTLRVWRKEGGGGGGKGGGVTSIWKNRDFEEEWAEEAKLPVVHEREVYAISWSRKTGKVVSTGSDGKIVVYEERWREGARDAAEEGTEGLTEWVAVAQIENAHDVFEVNHVVWAPRADKGKRWEGEEVIVSTGDDGAVKVWTLDP